MNQRHFGIRVGAFLLDLFVFYIAVAVVCMAIAVVIPAKISIPSVFNVNTCSDQAITRDDPVIVALNTPADAEIFRRFCTQRQMLVNRVESANVGYTQSANGSSQTRFISYNSDKDGNQVTVIPLDGAGALLFPFVTAWFLSRRGATPGKRALDLAVRTGDGVNPAYRRALAREAIKLAPILIFALSQIATAWMFAGSDPVELARRAANIDIAGLMLGGWTPLIAVAVSVAVFWFLFGSFIRWRGQAYWDRWTALHVVRAQSASPPSLPGQSAAPNAGA